MLLVADLEALHSSGMAWFSPEADPRTKSIQSGGQGGQAGSGGNHKNEQRKAWQVPESIDTAATLKMPRLHRGPLRWTEWLKAKCNVQGNRERDFARSLTRIFRSSYLSIRLRFEL